MADQLPMTGERFIPGMSGVIELEHMHRYALAVPLSRGKIVLDVASGEGYGSHLLASTAESVIGVDISFEAIEYASQYYRSANLEYRQGNCLALPIDDGSIDLVVSFETIEHHDQHEEMMREIVRVLAPNGFLLISSPNKKTYSDIPGTHNSFHAKELYFEEFLALLKAHFPYVELYGQRVLASSVIAPLLHGRSSFTQLQVTDKVVQQVGVVEPAIYFVAVAGSSPPLPELGISLYENSQATELGKDTSLVPSIFETKIFWRSVWLEKYDGYAEERASSVLYPVDAQRHTVRLLFPPNTGAVTRIRLDILNELGVVELHAVRLLDPSQREIWQWDGDLTIFQSRVQVVLLPVTGRAPGCTVVALGKDSWFELNLPDPVYAQVTPGCAFELELTPYWLLDRLPDIFQRLLLMSGLPKASWVSACMAKACNAAFQRPDLANDLESIAGLLVQTLSNRDKTIAQQHQQLAQMRDELLRAEAQLDLLKDVMLASREDERL